MREYSPKRRTALVLSGCGSSGAYHAGVLRALDESGVKVDLVVGSGVGTVGAAFAAVAGGPKLYGQEGFWDGLGWRTLFRLRPGIRASFGLLMAAFVVFLLPLLVALFAGLLFTPLLLLHLFAPELVARLWAMISLDPAALRAPYLIALAAPVFVLCVLAFGWLVRIAVRQRRVFMQTLETPFMAEGAADRLLRRLWEVARGIALDGPAPAPAELGRTYVTLAVENVGQPGFRELILRAGDLDTGRPLPFVLLQDEHRAAFAAARSRGPRSRLEGLPEAIDLRGPDHAALLFDAVLTGLLPPFVAPPRRVAFPRGGLFAGETHRLTDATMLGGTGLSEALEAGAEQVILVSASPHAVAMPARRRGPRALVDGTLAALERQAIERDVGSAERTNRMAQTLGHATGDGGRAWQDPETGREYRDFGLYVIRPQSRSLGPLDLDGAVDPSTEVEQTLADLAELGYRDAYRLFVEPVVGAAPESRPQPARGEPDKLVGL